MLTKEQRAGLAKLKEPFPAEQISKLPVGKKKDNSNPINCKVCGGYHQAHFTHLDYVGHAALTARLLDADPEWTWEPTGYSNDGTPALDKDGGLWIRLTVCGVTRLGYGDGGEKAAKNSAHEKLPGNATKEKIGDALRNAAMRFGAALDLWSKADLHAAEDAKSQPDDPKPTTDTTGAVARATEAASLRPDGTTWPEGAERDKIIATVLAGLNACQTWQVLNAYADDVRAMMNDNLKAPDLKILQRAKQTRAKEIGVMLHGGAHGKPS